jgi:hypothetical protein
VSKVRKVEGLAERGFSGKTRLKCLMSFGQVTANIGFTCSVSFPPLFEKILNVFAVFNMDILPALGLACRKFYAKRLLKGVFFRLVVFLCFLDLGVVIWKLGFWLGLILDCT